MKNSLLNISDNIQIKMSQKSGLNLLALQKNIQQSLSKPNSKQCCLMFEYKLLLLYSANFGIYVMPQSNAVQRKCISIPVVWHGVVFVRYGLYKDAKYKFKVSFQGFPKKAPKVVFVSQVYHPLVDHDTGSVDLGDIQKQWNYGTQHLIFTIIEYIRLLFLGTHSNDSDIRFYQNTQSYNKGAGQLFNSSPDQFFIKVRDSVQLSKTQLYQNYPDTSFKFTTFTSKHEKVRDCLKEVCEDQGLSFEEKKKKFVKMLKEGC